MRAIAVAALIAILPAAPAFAQNKPASKLQPDRPAKAEPEKRAKACSEYGAGFVPIEGTNSCVKASGYVRMQGYAR